MEETNRLAPLILSAVGAIVGELLKTALERLEHQRIKDGDISHEVRPPRPKVSKSRLSGQHNGGDKFRLR